MIQMARPLRAISTLSLDGVMVVVLPSCNMVAHSLRGGDWVPEGTYGAS